MLKQRILTALIIIPLILAAIYLLPADYFPWVAGIITVLGAWEWTALCGFKYTISRVIYMGVLIGIFLLISLFPVVTLFKIHIVSGAALAFWLYSILWLVRYQRQVKIIHLNRFVFGMVGFFILIPFWLGISILQSLDQQYQIYFAHQLISSKPHILLFVIIIVALADTGAYFAGRKWGKRKLASRISPGKTWEGLIGALVTVGFFTPVLANLLHIDKFGIVKLSLIVFVTVIAAVLGDLFESFVKRLTGVKDSGTVLPGHGGILDRIDSYTAAIPIFMAGYFLL